MRNRSRTSSLPGMISSQHPRRALPRLPRRRGLSAALFAALFLTPAASHAQTDNWNGGDGNWDVAANWSSGLPSSSSNVVNNTSGTITFDTGNVTINSFLNELTGGFNLIGGTLKTTTTFQNTNSGTLNLSAGTLNVGSNFVNSGSGAVNLSGATVNVTGSFMNSGTGIVTVTAGTTTIKGSVLSAGAFNLDGGTLVGTSAAVSKLEVDNSFLIDGGTLQNFTVNPGSGGQGVVFAADSSSALSGIVMNATMDVGVTNSNAIVDIYKSLTLNNTVTVDNSGRLDFADSSSNQTLGNSTGKTGTVALGVSGTGYLNIEDGGKLTIGSGITLTGNNGYIGGHYQTGDSVGNSLTNAGTISPNGGNLYIVSDSFTNSGKLTAANSSNLYLESTTTRLNGTLNIDSTSSIVASGTTINNSNTGFTVASGALTLSNATLQNATVNVSGTGTGLAFAPDTSNTLDNVTVKTNLNINNGGYYYWYYYNYNVIVPDALTVTGTSTIGGSNYGTLVFDNATANNTAGMSKIVLGGTTYSGYSGDILQTDGNTLTISSGTTLHGSYGTIGSLYNSYAVGDTLINQGIIASDVSGGNISINDTNFTNSGTLKAINGGTLTINSGTTWTNSGTLTTGSGGTIYMEGTLNNTGQTFDVLTNVTGTHNTILYTGAITGGNLNHSSLLNIQNGQLSNITLDGGVTVNGGGNTYAYIGDGVTFGAATPTTLSNGSGLYFNGSANPIFNTALVFGDGNSYNNLITNNSVLTLGSNALVHGNTGYVGYNPWQGATASIINDGTIDADISGGNLYVEPGTFTNNGALKADNGGTLYIATPWTNTGTLETSNGGTINLGGTLDNTGQTFDMLTNVTGTRNVILTGTLTGGNLTHSNLLNIQNGQLSNIILDGGVTETSYGTFAYIGDGVTFGTASPTTVDSGGGLAFNGSANPTFNTELVFGSNGNSYYNSLTSGNLTLTLGPNALVHGANGFIGYSPFVGPSTGLLINNGTIDADVSGGTITIQPTSFTNNGMLKADAGTLTISTNWTNTGTLETSNGGTINLGGTLDNSGQTFDMLTNVTGTRNVILTGTLTGGNLNHSNLLQISNGQLNNIILDGGVTVTSYDTSAYIGDGVTFGTASPTTVDSGGGLAFNGSANPTFNTELVLGSNSNSYYNSLMYGNLTLTLGPNALLHGANGFIGYSPFVGPSTGLLINNGTIDADVSGGNLYVEPNTFTNNGILKADAGNLYISTNWTNNSALKADNGGILNIAGTWTNNGTIAVSNGGSIILTGTLSGTLNNSSALQVQNGTLTNLVMDGGVMVNGGGGAYAYIGEGVTFGAATPTTISNSSGLYFNGATKPTFNTELIFGDSNPYNSLITNNSVLTLGSNALVHGNTGYIGYSIWQGATASIINNGTIDADVSGGAITIQPTAFTNNGALKADNSGTLYISSATNNLNGSISATGTGSAIYLGGAITLANNFVFNSSNGSAIYLDSNLNNGGNTFTIASGALTLNGVTLSNATVNGVAGTSALAFTNGTSNALNNVTVNSDLTIDNGYYTYVPTSLAVSGTTTIGDSNNYGYLVFNNATASNTAGMPNILLGGSTNSGYSGYIEQVGGNTLTISSGTTVHGSYGYIGDLYNGTGDTLINQGTIASDVSGGSISIDDKTFTNSGTLKAINGGTLNLNSANTVLNGTLSIDSTSAIIANGITINNNNTPFAISSGMLTLSSSTLKNATVNGNGSGTGLLISNGNSTLDTVTLNGDLDINAGSFVPNALTVTGVTNLGSNSNYGNLVFNNATANTAKLGEVVLGGTAYTGYYGEIQQVGGNTLTLSSGTMVHGSYGYIGDLYSGSSDTLINQGTIASDVSGGNISIDAKTFTNSGTLKAINGGTLNLNSTSNTVINGTLSVDSASAIIANGPINNNNSAFTVASGALTLNGVTLSNATVNGVAGTSALALAPYTSNTLNKVTVNSDLTIDNSPNGGGYYTYVPSSLAVSGTTTIGDSNGYGFLVFNNATASNTAGMPSILLGGSTNSGYSGYIEQVGGNTLTISSGTTVHGSSGYIGDLNSGSSDTLINQGAISNDVNGGSISIDDKIFTNSGTLSALNGGTVNINSTTTKFTGGQVRVDSSSSLSSVANITQTGGTTTVDGSLSLASGKSFVLQGGLLTGTGTIGGNVTSSGTVQPGDAPGTLTINGNYTQSSTGTLLIDLGGSNAGVNTGLLSVLDKATLAGALDVQLVNGFQAYAGESFDFMTYGSHSGSFSQILSLNMGLTYTVHYTGSTATLTVAGVPETSTVTGAALMLVTGGLLLRRRRQAPAPAKKAALSASCPRQTDVRSQSLRAATDKRVWQLFFCRSMHNVLQYV